jgi:hypothetical protein
VNRALVELVHEVERGRASLPTERVLAVLDRAGA